MLKMMMMLVVVVFVIYVVKVDVLAANDEKARVNLRNLQVADDT